jgi:hypothetical protein
LLPAFGHALCQLEQQAGRNTMPALDEGNRGGHFPDLQLLVN